MLWPLSHYFPSYIRYQTNYWEAYEEVNRLFCEATLKVIEPGDIVWVQDYQLMLLPKMIRNAIPDISIGYFHHIPFASYELFRTLPQRAQLLDGLLEQSANGLSAELALAAQQCLMKDYSLQHESHLDIYAMWHAHHEKGSVR